ncbi:chitobiase/beta-hexosaminidase C-terminal domain-containing protein [Mediterraneibacter massiliensis]|uniref:chitobiase/beta-hexosaminidase C-terminal domain-containing protein n=1 Tax=Mediterraneibacter massiliensis TaxID=1720300 RepID=UPI0024AD418D|nr:chitobiase/beta-hexosaminidase C-terminal domain-containing protein [Mediterraneibacter massiliensis]
MRCRHCGAVFSDEELICPKCGMQVQIVPDYNPLEDVLTQQVKGSVEDATRPIGTSDLRRIQREDTTEYGNSTRVLSQGELDRIRGSRRTQYQTRQEQGVQRKTTGNMRGSKNTGRVQGTSNIRTNASNTGKLSKSPEARRRQQMTRKKQAAKKRRQRLLIVLLGILLLLGIAGFVLYRNSYVGIVKQGYKALQTSEYSSAEQLFRRAIGRSSGKAEAYIGLSKVYIQQEDLDAAEEVFLSALETQPSNAEIYKAAIQFYKDTDQLGKISELLEGCEDQKVLSKVKTYVSPAPEFTPEEGNYDEVQQVTIKAEGSTIYYTTDGSEPTTSSTQYAEPILLEEGETQIQALAVNKKGIPSVVVSKTYTVQIPIANAPSVNPSTGTYSEAAQITVHVPEGYTAYYTLDGSEPTTASLQYAGPVDMPAVAVGEWTTFKAVLVNNNNGKMTQVTTKRYSLNLE